MKTVKILSLVAILFFVSCSKEESPKETKIESDIQAYNFLYMHYDGSIYFSSVPGSVIDNNGNIKLNYDSNGKVIKRIGGLTPLPSSISGGVESYAFSNGVTDDLIYTNNEIKITRNFPNCNGCSVETKITLDNQSRIIKKIIYKPYPEIPNDTVFYTYNNLGLIDETLKLKGRISRIREKAKFYYNQKQNLDSIVTKKYYDDKPEYSKQVEIFSKYDNAPNPLKKLILFEDTFFRAISKNNYTNYEKNIYSFDNQLSSKETRNWNFKYDDLGNIKFELY
jgi:hypothetical protein